jgi:hypothetical protein
MNGEMGRLWKEVIMTYFKILVAYAEGYHEKSLSG